MKRADRNSLEQSRRTLRVEYHRLCELEGGKFNENQLHHLLATQHNLDVALQRVNLMLGHDKYS